MIDIFNILLIEDEPEKWVPFFEFNDHGGKENELIKVETITSLAKGKRAIIRNHRFLDAVLIEFNFPDVSPDEVIKTLHWKRKNYPDLPVFILCANPDSENIDMITAFIKAGAVNYFNISNFRPAYLAAHLWASRENLKIRRQYEVVTTALSGDDPGTQPFLSIREMEGSLVSGDFAFHLETVKKPRTNEEEVEFIEYAERWHREFFRMLALIIDGQVTLTLQYVQNSKTDQEGSETVGVYWRFTITAIAPGELKREFEKTLRDINLYLGIPSLYPNNPYIFAPVTNTGQLELLINHEKKYRFSIWRKTAKCKSQTKEVGYGRNKSKDSHDAPVLSVFQHPEEWLSINVFCKILAQEADYTQFAITIQPGRVTDQDKKEAAKWSAGLPENFPLHKNEAELYQNFLEGLSHDTSGLFNIQFNLFTSEQIPNDAIKAALFNAFRLEHIADGSRPDQNVLFSDLYPEYSGPMFARLPLPQKEGIPGIETTPQNLLSLPKNISNDGVLIGHKLITEGWKNIRIKYSDLAQHACILGQTGTGKSTLLFSMIMDMLKNGKHVSLIDPHGDLYDQVVKNLSPAIKTNTVLFDPSVEQGIPGLNFLLHDPSDANQKSYLLNAIYVILDNLYDMRQTGGPIFMKYMQAALKLVMETGGTLLDVIRVYENKDYRNELLVQTNDPELKSEWNEILTSGGEASFANLSVYITSKLNEFRNNALIREILTKKEPQLDFGDIMNNGKNLLVRLPVGKLGERGVDLLGQFIFNKFLMTAFSRDKLKEDQRLNHILVIDEFHKFTTNALGKVFSEARKFNLNLIVANQTFSQLTDETRLILLGNVGSMMFFRPGINDAMVVEKYFEPDFTAKELCNLPNYHCATRISINRRPSSPFVFETIKIE